MSPTDVDFELFADGACSGNLGPGGWAYVLREKSTGQETEASDGELMTTNNRMELMSVIRGLSATKPGSSIRVTTDSNYVAKGISEWMAGWKSRGWKRMEGGRPKPLKNAELWQELDGLVCERKVSVQWVRGHAGHAENERCDVLAVEAYQRFLR
ncbi:ribonuclease HI [bacterium]|nr:ribonuclease HI [bacterium]